ncbi:hypothetical protein P0Y35_16095 [Kiritimatiellaeota bacterium B1221]|nr:hypothetical protein [Kiritimatiellaeota bacterium B1221]
MKKILLSCGILLSVFSMTACKSPAKKAVVKHETGIGKGPVEKAGDKADKKMKNTKKDLDKKLP